MYGEGGGSALALLDQPTISTGEKNNALWFLTYILETHSILFSNVFMRKGGVI